MNSLCDWSAGDSQTLYAIAPVMLTAAATVILAGLATLPFASTTPGPAAGVTAGLFADVTPTSATGSVAFSIDGTPVAGCADRPVLGGRASCGTAFPTAGPHTVTAAYSGAALVDFMDKYPYTDAPEAPIP